jgi:hypothetical protein
MDKNKYLNFEGLEKYDKLIKSYIALNNKTLVDNIDTLNVDVAALKSIDHDAYISADIKLEQSIKEYTDIKIETKQDVITDLETIRSGAALGATAVQQIPSEYITETELADKEYATTSQVENLIDDAVVVATDDEIDNLFKI